ncbi:unnamed protein product [Cylicocyclus nassatus]|uniref:cystathionine gamma-lyase n=1 Tax=Cylicocyclus nassatus TaxID=53992 RepID=A0AA36HAB8_CYLNA|nr:unnamed protein product [Cylicocyclus nassatus]
MFTLRIARNILNSYVSVPRTALLNWRRCSRFDIREVSNETFPRFGTTAIHAGQEPDQWGALNQVVPPISMSSSYKQDRANMENKYFYSRCGNPSRDVLERCLASLEEGKYGHAFASGMAAIMSVINILKAGDHMICADNVYGGTQCFIRLVAGPYHNIGADFVDMTDVGNVKRALKPNTKLIWLETPTNPLLKIIDIASLVRTVKEEKPQAIVVVDNTFMTPYFQRPLTLGADVVVHSCTKYINGHSDVVMGAAITNNQDIHDYLLFQQMAVGAIPSPFDCFLCNRGLKTLHVRMRTHYENALAVAKFLEDHKRVEKVLYPALPSHPQHKLHTSQTKGMSGMVSFYLKGGLYESEKFLSNLKLFSLAVSLGGYESLAELPSTMTHHSVPEEERKKLQITDNLIRLSVGLESSDDLIADLNQALKIAVKVGNV